MSKDKIAARCLKCEGEFTEEQIFGAVCCPSCKSRSIPCDPADDIKIDINFHELSILMNWSYFWAAKADNDKLDDAYWESMKDTVKLIAKRIRKTMPEEFKSKPLYLAEEVEEIQKEYPGTTLFIGGKEEI